MAQSVIQFVKIIYGVRIKQLVIDFIRDAKGNYWMTDVKNFQFDEFEKIKYLAIKDS